MEDPQHYHSLELTKKLSTWSSSEKKAKTQHTRLFLSRQREQANFALCLCIHFILKFPNSSSGSHFLLDLKVLGSSSLEPSHFKVVELVSKSPNSILKKGPYSLDELMFCVLLWNSRTCYLGEKKFLMRQSLLLTKVILPFDVGIFSQSDQLLGI